MRKMSFKKAVAVGAGAVIVASGAGVAFAYWTSTGTGTGTATTGSDTKYTVTIDNQNLQNLTPAGPTDSISFHVMNGGSGVQHLGNTVAKVVNTSNAGCTAADFSVGTTSITYGDIAAGATVDGTFSLQMKNLASNQDACKGVTVDLQVDAS